MANGLISFLVRAASLLAIAVPLPGLAAERASVDLSEHYGHVFQIRVVSFRHSTEHRCESDFVRATEASPGRYDRLITCIRAYKDLSGLFDSVLMVLSVDDEAIRRSTLSVSGAEQRQIMALNRRFTEEAL